MASSNPFTIFLNTSFLLLALLFTTSHLTNTLHTFHLHTNASTTPVSCEPLDHKSDPKSKCSHIRSQPTTCIPQGFIDYLTIFYCVCEEHPLFGYALLTLWLLILFYVLSDTASRYFCPALEGLARELRLSPAIAGATLVALGNGAPDAFAAAVSFASSGNSRDVGVSSVLGGGLFVSTAVVGVVAMSVPADRAVIVDAWSFARDAGSLLSAQVALVVLLSIGSLGFVATAGFLSMYLLYVVMVSVMSCREDPDLAMLVEVLIEEDQDPIAKAGNRVVCGGHKPQWCGWWRAVVGVLEMPLYIPRRVTIPVVDAENWSRWYAVAAAGIGPVLVGVLWSYKMGAEGEVGGWEWGVYILAGMVGVVLVILAIWFTDSHEPPKRFLLPWLAGGFVMSVIWSYMTAAELVALLTSLAQIIGMAPSSLALTVLAWGNSAGDLTTNLAMAINGGEAGVQAAISACYAGPLFNIVVGLGLFLLFSAWQAYPNPATIPIEMEVFEVIGFLMVGLLWAMVVVGRRGMKVDRLLGIGLVAIYLCFLCVSVSKTVGILDTDHLDIGGWLKGPS